MVSYNGNYVTFVVHTNGDLMGDFIQPVFCVGFGVNWAFNGTLLQTPILPVSLIFDAPQTAYGGFSCVLIADFPSLGSILPVLRVAQ
jgi:hypothetical protein